MSFGDMLAGARRLFILRALIEQGGHLNESIIWRAVCHGVAEAPRDAVRGDLDLLRERGCITEEWLDGRLRVATITDRGEDAAHGRVEVAGVEHSRWSR